MIDKHSNFTIAELVKSNTAKQLGINNNAPYPAIVQLGLLISNILDPLRDELGHPIIVTSGYRSHKLNSTVGGVPDSQHLTGNAVDIISRYATPKDMWEIAQQLSLNFDKNILEGTSKNPDGRWLHISHVAENNRNKSIILP